LEKTNLGVSDEGHIAGGDTRIFAVRVGEEDIEEIAHVIPPARPRGRALPLREASSIKEAVLARPSFFEHFDSVVVDWRYLRERDKEELKRESRWISRQGLKLFIDLSSGINLYPDLLLLDGAKQDYAATLAAVEELMEKMQIFPVHDLIFSLHRYPEGGHFTKEQSWQSFERTVRQLCERARRQDVTVYLRLSVGKPPEDLKQAVEFIGRVSAPNLRLAPSTAFLLAKGTELSEATKLLEGRVGVWLVDTPQRDIAGRVWNGYAPIREYQDRQSLAKILAIAPESMVVLDAVYKNHDEEYLDAKTLQEILRS
jgi:hypothetical protein